MKRSLSAVLGLGLLLSACGQPASPSSQSNVPAAYRDTRGAAWSYTASPASVRALGTTTDSPLWNAMLSARSSWGPIEVNTSNGEKSAGDGHPLTMNGVVYPYGLGLHAGAEIILSSSQPTQPAGVLCELTAEVGIDAEVGHRGSVSFQVFADGAKLYDSGMLRGGDPSAHLSAILPRAKVINLVVSNGGDDYYYDHADIAAPVVRCSKI